MENSPGITEDLKIGDFFRQRIDESIHDAHQYIKHHPLTAMVDEVAGDEPRQQT